MKTEKEGNKFLIGGRIKFEPNEKSFLIVFHGLNYRIYMDELSQMFAIAFQEGLLNLRVFANSNGDEIWGGKFNLELKDEKWFEEENSKGIE